jgi:hypothetical protein
METHEVYLETFDLCSISYSANVYAIFEYFPCKTKLCFIDLGYGV